MKKCTKCGEVKPLDDFGNNPKGKNGKRSYCKKCGQLSAYNWHKKNPEKSKALRRRGYCRNIKTMMINSARYRAARKGIEFSLTKDDFEVPEYCPILGIRLEIGVGTQQDNSPSLDRLDSTKGYTSDNVWVISGKANTMKANASVDELISFANWIGSTYA